MRTLLKSFLIVCGILAATVGTAAAQTQSLVDILVSQLGVTSEQATGGAGSIFDLAKQNMTPDEFSQVAAAVPEMDTLLAAAPAAAADTQAQGTKSMGSMSGMASKSMSDATSAAKEAGASAGASAGGLASLVPSFEQLGMSPDMVEQFVPVVLEFVNSEAGAATMNLLKAALL